MGSVEPWAVVMRAFSLANRETDSDPVSGACIVVIGFAGVEVSCLPMIVAPAVGIAHAGTDCAG